MASGLNFEETLHSNQELHDSMFRTWLDLGLVFSCKISKSFSCTAGLPEYSKQYQHKQSMLILNL